MYPLSTYSYSVVVVTSVVNQLGYLYLSESIFKHNDRVCPVSLTHRTLLFRKTIFLGCMIQKVVRYVLMALLFPPWI